MSALHPLMPALTEDGAGAGDVDASAQAPSPAPVRMVRDTLHGIPLDDPYRWMEEPANAEFAGWMQEHGRYAQARFAAIPTRDGLVQRIRELTLSSSAVARVARAGDALFFFRSDSGAALPRLTTRAADGGERVLFDPSSAVRDNPGQHVSIENFMPSPDGGLVALNLAQGGGEISRVHVLETATGALRPDVIERIWGEFAVSWLPDGSGFFYTQMAPEGFADPTVDKMLGMRVRLHRLGTVAEDDPVVLGPGVNPAMPLEPDEFPWIEVPRGSEWMLAYAGGARAELRLCVAPVAGLRGAETPWRRVAEYDDLVEGAAMHGASLYLLSSKDAPNRRILRTPLAEPVLASAAIAVPEREDRVISEVVAARDAVYVREMVRGSDRVLRLADGDGAPREVPLPLPEPAVSLAASPDHDGILFSAQGWTQPNVWYAFDPAAGAVRELGLRSTSPADFSAVEVESVDVESFDGAQVPLTILRLRGAALDGSHPAVMMGYGAYGYSTQPNFNAARLAWLERGGVFAVCHARGGGEKGRAWYLGGQGANKGNGVRDFIACAEYLSAKGYTRPSRLGGLGGSMAGILVGRAITERPDAFGAAVIQAGQLNPVRFLEGANGANQMSELGDPATVEGYRALVAMDPYHHVRSGVSYPAVLLAVGLNDNRVSGWNSGKFAARLLAASADGNPVLIRIDDDAGHGVGSTRDQAAAQQADMFAFLFWRLGHPDFQPRG